MVEMMALIEDIVEVEPIERLEFPVCGGGVTPIVDGVKVLLVSGLKISAMKDTVQAMVDEVGLSISKGGGASPNVGLSWSKYGKGGGDTICLFGKVGGGG